MTAPVLETLLRRDRAIVAVGLGFLVAIAWGYTFWMSFTMGPGAMGPGNVGEMAAMPHSAPWSVTEAMVAFVMCSVMMMAMMIPTAAPMTLLFAAIERRREFDAAVAARSGLFIGGYVAVWSGFAAMATAAQFVLHASTLLSGETWSVVRPMGAAILVLAGVYQFTPVKRVCLTYCRSPIEFLSRFWRPGPAGAFRMGLVHGIFCVGCCWALMLLLFAAGIMNLLWVAGIMIVVSIEKVLPAGVWLGRAGGIALIAAGVGLGVAAI